MLPEQFHSLTLEQQIGQFLFIGLPGTELDHETRDLVSEVQPGGVIIFGRNVAGPEVFPLDELGRITLAARGDQRTVVTDDTAGLFAAASGDALIAKEDAVIFKTTYREFLAR